MFRVFFHVSVVHFYFSCVLKIMYTVYYLKCYFRFSIDYSSFLFEVIHAQPIFCRQTTRDKDFELAF